MRKAEALVAALEDEEAMSHGILQRWQRKELQGFHLMGDLHDHDWCGYLNTSQYLLKNSSNAKGENYLTIHLQLQRRHYILNIICNWEPLTVPFQLRMSIHKM